MKDLQKTDRMAHGLSPDGSFSMGFHGQESTKAPGKTVHPKNFAENKIF